MNNVKLTHFLLAVEMNQHYRRVLVVNSAVLSLISCLAISVDQSAVYGNQKQLAPSKSTSIINDAPTLNSNYTPEQINYFLEVALGTEYGTAKSTIKKWDRDIRIQVIGTPTPEDRITLQAVIDEINRLTGSIRLQMNADNPNMKIYFVPESKFARYEPNYQPRNYGFFWNSWTNDTIYNSRVLISTVGISQKERSHLIREELTQALGLMKDSKKYRESIFFQGWTDPTNYAQIDKALIEMLYRPEIRPGMTKSQVLAVFKELQMKQEATAECRPTDANPALDFSVERFCPPH